MSFLNRQIKKDKLEKAAREIAAALPTKEETEKAAKRIRASKHVYIWYYQEEDPDDKVFALVPEEVKNRDDVLEALVTASFLIGYDSVYDAKRSKCHAVLDSLDLTFKAIGGRDTNKTLSGLHDDLVVVPFPHVYESHPDNDPEPVSENEEEEKPKPDSDEAKAAELLHLMDEDEPKPDSDEAKAAAKEAETAEVVRLIDEEPSDDDEPAPPSPGTKRGREGSATEQSPSKKPKTDSE